MTRRRSRWSTCRPLLAYRAESAHQRPGTSGVGTGLIGIGPRFGSIGVWSEQTRIVWSLVLAGLLGVVLAWIENTDQLHSRVRKLRITHQTSFSSEWYGALSQARGAYLVLHLTGERRLYGWVLEWPNTSEHGHFVMAEAEWLLVNGDRIPLEGVEQIVIRVQDVEMVELMQVKEDHQSITLEKPNGRP